MSWQEKVYNKFEFLAAEAKARELVVMTMLYVPVKASPFTRSTVIQIRLVDWENASMKERMKMIDAQAS